MQAAQRTLANALTELVGRELSSVEFVRDYLQLHVDGASLTAYTLPVVTVNCESLNLRQPGYRDALCSQIGDKVTCAESHNDCVSIAFARGTTVSISLLEADYQGPEALQFRLDTDPRTWVV